MAKRILLVDDEPLIVKGLKFALESDGYETDSAGDGEQALEKIQNGNFDLILLDVMLPKMSGIEVCQAVREKSDVPIIMLTAKGEDMDKILGLEYGADDYMTKPFNILEVKARIKTILRRAGAGKEAPRMEITAGDITININTRSVISHGEPVNLTVKEFDLLNLFMSNIGKIYSRDELRLYRGFQDGRRTHKTAQGKDREGSCEPEAHHDKVGSWLLLCRISVRQQTFSARCVGEWWVYTCL